MTNTYLLHQCHECCYISIFTFNFYFLRLCPNFMNFFYATEKLFFCSPSMCMQYQEQDLGTHGRTIRTSTRMVGVLWLLTILHVCAKDVQSSACNTWPETGLDKATSTWLGWKWEWWRLWRVFGCLLALERKRKGIYLKNYYFGISGICLMKIILFASK